MKKALLAVAVFLSLFIGKPASAEPKSAFLFKIEKGGKHSYLLGTWHWGVALNELPPCVTQAVHSSNSFICEIVEDLRDLTDDERGELLYDREGPSLSQKLSHEAWLTLQRRIPQLSVRYLRDLRPGAATLFLQANNRTKARRVLGDTSLDYEILAHAGQMEPFAKIQGLETQRDRILPVTHEELEVALEGPRGARGPESEITLDELKEIYLSGNLEIIAQGNEERYADNPVDFYRNLIRRNLNWIPKIEAIHASEGAHFFFVGVGHLPGDKGLLHLLKARGFQISQVGTDPCAEAVEEFSL